MRMMDDLSIGLSAIAALRRYQAQQEKKKEPDVKVRLIKLPEYKNVTYLKPNELPDKTEENII